MTDLSTDARLVLASCRVAAARLRLEQHAIEEVAAFLSAGRISAMGAIAMLREGEVAGLVLREVSDKEAA